MKKTIACLLFLVALPVMAASITVEHEKGFAFNDMKTFQFVDTDETRAKDPLMADGIVALIKKKLAEAGLQEVESNPDLRVTYHFTSVEHQVLDTELFGTAGSVQTGTPTGKTYDIGTLIVEAYEGGKTNLVWQGTGTVTEKKQFDKKMQQIEKMLDKMRAKWKQILADEQD